jgi:hypothetical protein
MCSPVYIGDEISWSANIIYTQYRMKSTFETMTFFHTPIRLVELLILYACVQFYTHQASDYRLISQTALLSKLNVSEIHNKINIANFRPIDKIYTIYR